MQDVFYASVGVTVFVALIAGFFALFLVPFHFGTRAEPTRMITKPVWFFRVLGISTALAVGGYQTAPGIAADGSAFLLWGAVWVGLAMVSFHLFGVWTRQLAWCLNRTRAWCWWIMAPFGIVGMLFVPVRRAPARPTHARAMPAMVAAQ